MRWRISISNLEGDTRLLKEVLAAIGVTVIADGEETFLVGELFEEMALATAVHTSVKRIEATLAELEQNDPELRFGFHIGPIHEQRADGTWLKHHFASLKAGLLGMATLSASLTVGPSKRLTEEERLRREFEAQEREFQNKCQIAVPQFVAAFRDERAVQVLRLLRGDSDPLTLGHVAEIIEDDFGGGFKELVSKAQWTRFHRSINHPDVFGVLARHIVSNDEPPAKPMQLSEARAFVTELARRWMLRKAGKK